MSVTLLSISYYSGTIGGKEVGKYLTRDPGRPPDIPIIQLSTHDDWGSITDHKASAKKKRKQGILLYKHVVIFGSGIYKIILQNNLSGESKSTSPIFKKRQDFPSTRENAPTRPQSLDRSPSNPPVRLPHSPKPFDNVELIPSKSAALNDSKEDILPGLCSCLFGLCGCVTGLELCALLPKLCTLLAGLCGSLSNSGVPPRQDHSPLMDQVQ